MSFHNPDNRRPTSGRSEASPLGSPPRLSGRRRAGSTSSHSPRNPHPAAVILSPSVRNNRRTRRRIAGHLLADSNPIEDPVAQVGLSSVHRDEECRPKSTVENSARSQHELQPLAQNMAKSSVVEYEIGALVSQALDKVGDLVELSTQRLGLHSAIANDPTRPLDMVMLRSTLNDAIREAFDAALHSNSDTTESQSSRTSNSTKDRSSDSAPSPTSCRLTSHQLQELGATFGRNPSGLGDVVEKMWLSGATRPDLANVVTRPSNLLVS